MLDRRTFLLGAGALLLSPQLGHAHHKRKFKISPKLQPKRVSFSGYPRGTIVVDPRKRALYFVEDSKSATRYVVGVGKAGQSFRGTAVIGHKAEWPGWRPTDEMIRKNPWKYSRYRNGVPGGPKRPRSVVSYSENGRPSR